MLSIVSLLIEMTKPSHIIRVVNFKDDAEFVRNSLATSPVPCVTLEQQPETHAESPRRTGAWKAFKDDE